MYLQITPNDMDGSNKPHRWC